MAKSKHSAPASLDPNNPAETETGTEVVSVATGTALAPHEAKSSTMTLPGGLVIEVAKSVTRPVLKQIPRIPVFVTVESAIYTGKELAGVGRDGQPKEKPADLMDVVDLSTGEDMVLIANSVLRSELEREYPETSEGAGDWGYVGRSFAVLSFEPDEQKRKRYRTYSIKEITIKGRVSVVKDVATPPLHSAASEDATGEAA